MLDARARAAVTTAETSQPSSGRTWSWVRWFLIALGVVLWVNRGVHDYKVVFFDDAFMFYRYALHMRSGLGVSWNLNGQHTYGQTSLLWGLVVFLFSFLPLAARPLLVFSSWLFAGLALLSLAWSIARNARTVTFRSIATLLAITAPLLLLCPMMERNLGTGMETMLGLGLCAVLVGQVLALRSHGTRPITVAVTGCLLFLSRPESAAVVTGMLLMTAWLYPQARQSALLGLLLFAAGLAVVLLACRMYFGTALPLSFYMKSRQAYAGYPARWYPVSKALNFVSQLGPFLVITLALARSRDWPWLALFYVPLIVVVAYLCTVTQIMGYESRYYVPYLPLVVAPALLLLDARWNDGGLHWDAGTLGVRLALVAGLIFVLQSELTKNLAAKVDELAERRSAFIAPEMTTDAGAPLPSLGWERSIVQLGDMIGTLPQGTTVAASEVGYIGARAPRVNVIDLAGLNDTEFALQGFSVDRLLARQPDLIWLPNPDYTYQRGDLVSNPAFLANYELWDGAADYGLAVRKASPYRAVLEADIHQFMTRNYPGLNADKYLVREVHWNRTTQPVPFMYPTAANL